MKYDLGMTDPKVDKAAKETDIQHKASANELTANIETVVPKFEEEIELGEMSEIDIHNFIAELEAAAASRAAARRAGQQQNAV